MWQAKYASAIPKNRWEWIFGRAVKAISSMGVRSPCTKSFYESVATAVSAEVVFFCLMQKLVYYY